MRTIALALFVCAFQACDGSGPSPTAPSPPNAATLLVECPPSLILGQATLCVAFSRNASGQLTHVSPVATWRSSSPDIVEVDGTGRVTGRSGGSANVSASFEGATATAPIVVRAEDALVLTSSQSQWDGKVGSEAMLALGGNYAVVSAERGGVTLETRRDDGSRVGATALEVARGGAAFFLQNRFVMPANTERVCVFAVLIVNGMRFEEPKTSTFNCLRVQP